MNNSKSPQDLHILAVHAHPDDIEIQCAGTLLQLEALGCRISVATMTPGDCGSAEMSQDEIADVRRGEAAAAAVILNRPFIFANPFASTLGKLNKAIAAINKPFHIRGYCVPIGW